MFGDGAVGVEPTIHTTKFKCIKNSSQLCVWSPCMCCSQALFSSWDPTCLLVTAALWMLNVSFRDPFWSCWKQPKRFPATVPTDRRISCGSNVSSPPTMLSPSQSHPRGQTSNRKTSRLAKQPAVRSDSPCSLPPDMSFFSSCCSPQPPTHAFGYFVTQPDISKQVQVFLIIGCLQWSCVLMAHNIKDNLITLWLV